MRGPLPLFLPDLFLEKAGEYAGTAGGRDGPIRDLEPDRRCPDDLMGEVHANGRV